MPWRLTTVSTPQNCFNRDHTDALDVAQREGKVTPSALRAEHGWGDERATKALRRLLTLGLVWADDQSGRGEREYWLPGPFLQG